MRREESERGWKSERDRQRERQRERDRERNRERLTQPLSFSVFQYIDIYVGRERE